MFDLALVQQKPQTSGLFQPELYQKLLFNH